MYTSPAVYLSESLDWVYQVGILYLVHASVVIVIVRIVWTISLRYSRLLGRSKLKSHSFQKACP